MGTLFAHQSMPHEKRAPLAYLDYSLNNNFGSAEPRLRDQVGPANSAVTETSSDSSSHLSWRPTASQSSAQTTPDSISSYNHLGQSDSACLGTLQDPVQSVDVPSWREGVEKENQTSVDVLPSSQRQHSRRTRPGCRGTDARHVSPPTTLVRQPERRHCFVSSLVIFAAGLIAAIWPLSAPVLHDTTYAHNVLPLQDFITETLRRSKTSYSTLQVAMYYLILLKEYLPKCDFTQEQSCVPTDRRAMQCGRRMFLSALMLASKFLQDRNYSTRAWGKITGLPTSEINTNELKFLEAVDWQLHVSKERFERWSHTVLALSAPPKPGMSLIPQPSLVETIGWDAVLARLTPECLDDFSQFRDGLAPPNSQGYPGDFNGLLTPPSSPPDSTVSEQEDSSCERSEAKRCAPNMELSNESNSASPAPPPAPYQQNLPTPRGTPRLSQSSSSVSRTHAGTTRCRDSSSAMAMLKLCARPATRTLCPPPCERPFPRPVLSVRPSLSRRCSTTSSASTLSSPESVRTDLSGFPGRSRSSSISSVASSVIAPYQASYLSEASSTDVQPSSCTQRYGLPPKANCSSTLRPEEYSAADALLRFHESRQWEANREQSGTRDYDLKRMESTRRSIQASQPWTQSPGSTEKTKKKRTHSKTNISDLLTLPEDDLQSLVRQDLMASHNGVSGTVFPEVCPKETVGRHCKRNRSTRGQSSAVDLTRILLKEKNKENRPMWDKSGSTASGGREALARCVGRF